MPEGAVVYIDGFTILIPLQPFAVPNSLTREEGSVNPNIKHSCQTVPLGSPDMPYLSKIPPFLGALTPQFQIGSLIKFCALEWNSLATTSNCYH